MGKAIADDELLSLFDIDTQPVSDVEEIISLYTHGEYNKVIEKNQQ
ncbi:hypothetical protein [Pectobacterium versatile]|uniref:Uncharacterized protein n=1 Tax=Pectobacterium versatile TaxID=2488639 RepID=A0A7T0HHQ8_9GAMM|nr:hypothetical protein [Pectobacterium versatile]QPK17725.1 hypothetical protein F131LOC_010580 [Pectobacterium versatile]